jgi:hypothetical protein
MSDIARPYPAGQTPSGYAADSRGEAPRVRAAGQENAHNGNSNLARHGGDSAK